MSSLINEFLSQNKNKRFEYDINSFIAFLEYRTGETVADNNEHVTIKKLNETDAYAYIQFLETVGNNKPATVNRKLSTIKQFFDFLYQNRYIEKNIFYKIKAKQTIQRNHREYLNKEQVKKIISRTEDQTRNLLLFLFVISYQCSINELQSMKKEDISYHNIIIGSNTKKERNVVNYEPLRSILSDYLSKSNTNTPLIFSSKKADSISERMIKYVLGNAVKSVFDSNEAINAMRILKNTSFQMMKEYTKLDDTTLDIYFGNTTDQSEVLYDEDFQSIRRGMEEFMHILNYK